jgi:hypothetical protein
VLNSSQQLEIGKKSSRENAENIFYETMDTPSDVAKLKRVREGNNR